MLTQEQIEKQVAIFLRGPYEMTIRQALLTGATWAANKIDTLCADGAKMIEQLQAEKERLRAAIQTALRQTNDKLHVFAALTLDNALNRK